MPVGIEFELEGLDELEGGPPKKSRPSRESAAFAGLGAADNFGGGGLAPGVSVVFGLVGGAGTSPNRSNCGAGLGGGGTGWTDVEESLCEEARSNLAFS